MFDIKLIREELETVKKGLAAKGAKIILDDVLQKDKKRRDVLTELDQLRNEKNLANETISLFIKEKKDPKEQIAAMKVVSLRIAELEPQVKDLEAEINSCLLGIPNLPHPSVPIGGPESNREVRCWGDPKHFDFKPKTHIEIAEDLDIIDFKRATKISGSHFILFKKAGARLERALYNFMLDIHTAEHGYTEVFPPVLVNRQSMTGTGQLPKMEEDMYKLKDDDLFLIPTAEVPVTNIHRDEIFNEDELPVYYAAYSPCFRREAGSYGKDTRGLVRVHQFDKVELVKFVKPETSYEEHEKLVANAERIFQLLGLPYRVVLLASGDMSFAAAKCYDIEAYAAGMERWLEVSSCSNFEDFQARRANIRFKGKETKKTAFVHTLNGSGVALARTLAALIENYQNEDGSVMIPLVLQPYMGGLKRITRD
ncbi:MAG TPA: serine--tRNA ligase [Candidatus Omnitrophica bacterium]|nr:MAG: serine--tRNA ligase [Omnitrophica WOR_2 bacterium GWA2_45_18]OGX19369.1 MAG: serine--tRNA ligase [Omnitrophica WOR_2 bacterium GWC2_45_7]HBR15624.1 serine--tRNA ligase [Candidatus Omnitrophota bacterium]